MAAIARNRMSQHSHVASNKTMLFLIALILLVGFMALAGFHPTTTTSPPFTTSTSLMMTDQRKHAIRASAPPTPSFLKKTRGSSWELWDGHSVLYNDLNFAPCRWTQFYVPGEEASSHITSLPMCVHPEADIISDAIAAGGRWQDCPYLGSVWHSLEQQDNQQHKTQSRQKVHLEVGANIGACVLDVLLTTNAHIVAFEPNPRNLFRLTSTLSAVLAVYPHFESRIQLYPLGLGDTAKKDLIFGAARNFGHSTIGHGVKEYPGQQFDKGLPIYIERLDDLINCKHNDPQVEFSVMKLDAQGRLDNLLQNKILRWMEKERDKILLCK